MGPDGPIEGGSGGGQDIVVTPWARGRIRRRLAGIAAPEEQLVHIERLRAGGWWATTDQALYHVPRSADVERVAFGQIRSVRHLSAGSAMIVVNAEGHQPLVGDLPADSRLVQQLREVGPGPSA